MRARVQHLVLILLFALIFIGSQQSRLGQVVRQSRKEVAKPLPIRLILQTTKQQYRFGEPVTITAYLENLSDRSYYVGNTLVSFWGTVGLHEMRLSIFDNDGEVKIGRGGGAWIWKPGTTTAEKLAQTYVELKPNAIHGLTEKH